MTAELTFWAALLFVAYAYVGYPLALRALLVVRDRGVAWRGITPRTSFIVTAHNEERTIREKLENTLALDYPVGALEVIVASDCSTDATDAIVASFADRGVRLVRAPERRGKEAAQKLAVEASTGEVLVFSDVATRLEPGGLRRIVGNFADPTVGCVSSVDRFVRSDGGAGGEGAYVRYEMWLRDLESRVNTLVGLSGSFFAARRRVCAGWHTDRCSDFNTLLHAVGLGLRGVSDREAVGYYKPLRDPRREYHRKVRTVVGGMTVFLQSLPLVNPLRYPLFAWQLVSHKLCRWLVPLALIVAFTSHLVLASRSRTHAFMLAAHVGFYLSSALGLARLHRGLPRALLLPSYFVLVNASILHAWWRYLAGDRSLTWKPSER